VSKLGLFKKSITSNIVHARGPSANDQLASMASGEYWTVLNTSILITCANNKDLCHRVNALKHALQTYGPESNELPDFRHNKGKSQGFVFHGHANNSSGTTYVLEWAVVDRSKKIIALTGFGTHENFKFRQDPLNEMEIVKILSSSGNVQIMEHVSKKIHEAKEKVERFEATYKNVI
jgi:hypothetical protein